MDSSRDGVSYHQPESSLEFNVDNNLVFFGSLEPTSFSPNFTTDSIKRLFPEYSFIDKQYCNDNYCPPGDLSYLIRKTIYFHQFSGYKNS